VSRHSGPPCGNNPNHRMTPGDRKAVEEFKAYLAARREAETAPCPGHEDTCMWNRCTGRESTRQCMCPVCVGDTPEVWGYDGDY
jgi:hypothetical protein